MIAVVDYRAGNLTSVMKALDHVGAAAVVSDDPDLVAKADKIILPGVGHFSSTTTLERAGLRAAIQHAVERGAPFLGICVGMQWMFQGSAESPETKGLGLLPGECERFPPTVKSPHVGWNSLSVRSSSRLFRGVPPSPFVYFTHSFRASVDDATVACCQYGGEFSAAVERNHVFGVQFHPEKSGETGLALLRNFLRILTC